MPRARRAVVEDAIQRARAYPAGTTRHVTFYVRDPQEITKVTVNPHSPTLSNHDPPQYLGWRSRVTAFTRRGRSGGVSVDHDCIVDDSGITGWKPPVIVCTFLRGDDQSVARVQPPSTWRQTRGTDMRRLRANVWLYNPDDVPVEAPDSISDDSDTDGSDSSDTDTDGSDSSDTDTDGSDTDSEMTEARESEAQADSEMTEAQESEAQADSEMTEVPEVQTQADSEMTEVPESEAQADSEMTEAHEIQEVRMQETPVRLRGRYRVRTQRHLRALDRAQERAREETILRKVVRRYYALPHTDRTDRQHRRKVAAWKRLIRLGYSTGDLRHLCEFLFGV